MDTLANFPKGFTLITSPDNTYRQVALDLLIEIALQDSIWVLDAGNRFKAFNLARACRRRTVDLETTLRRIQIARAFTPYHLHTLAQRMRPIRGTLFLLDCLALFDADIAPYQEQNRLLSGIIKELLSGPTGRTVVVTAPEPDPQDDIRRKLYRYLLNRSHQQVTVNDPLNAPSKWVQATLWEKTDG